MGFQRGFIGTVREVGGEEAQSGQSADPRGLVLFAVAMLLHFLVNDYGLREKHRDDWQHIVWSLLSSIVILGWVIGLHVEIPEVLTALLPGGIILDGLKEELTAYLTATATRPS
ncbi:MAG: hypothetical protein M3Q29_22045 [Chloroflexota bacterium]|nr:hypothetical protein [Chloroflexota bacterium]